MRASTLTSLFVCAIELGYAPPVHARATRRYFEPTDLEMERPGMLDLDLQVGVFREEQPWRGSVPDFEIDLGLAPGVELDVDGGYHVEGSQDAGWHDARGSFDNLWVAAKLALYDSRSVGSLQAWALGVQLGPKLPLAADARGLGYEGLLLLSRTWTGGQIVVNAGGFVDPGDQLSGPRPAASEAGLDFSVETGLAGLSVTAELGGVHFFSADLDQLHATAGVSWALGDALDLSLVGVLGLSGDERGGVLLGVSPKFRLWP